MWSFLLATDGSECAQDAVRLVHALQLPAGSKIQVCTVLDPRMERRLAAVHVYPVETAEERVARTAAELSAPGLEVTWAVLQGQPGHALITEAERSGVNLILVGSRGLTGLQGLILGSVARNVAYHAPCSVLVARPLRHGLRHLILATDGSEDAARAADLAATLPVPADARFTVATVLRPPNSAMELPQFQAPLYCGDMESERQAAEALTGSVCAFLEGAGRKAWLDVLFGDPSQELLRLAEDRRADLILLGARGLSLIERLLVGSVSDHVVKFAPCSVLVAR